MKYCEKCNVKVNTDSQKCPLCSMLLTAESDADTDRIACTSPNPAEAADKAKYPEPEEGNIRRYNFLFRFVLFISVVIGSSCLLINFLTYSGYLWSLYVVGTLMYIWIAIVYPLFSKKKIGRIIVLDSIVTSIYVFALELGTQTQGWGLTYVTPFIFITATLMITFIIFLKRLKWREYTIYQTIMVIMGFLPIVFCVTGLVTSVWPSILSAFYSFLTLAGMFIFADKKYKDELIKRFHL